MMFDCARGRRLIMHDVDLKRLQSHKLSNASGAVFKDVP